MNIEKSTKTSRNYKKYLSHEKNISFLCDTSIFFLTSSLSTIVFVFFKFENLIDTLKFILCFLAIVILSIVLCCYIANKFYFNAKNTKLYELTMFKSFCHYYYPHNTILAEQDNYEDQMSKLFWLFKNTYNSSQYNSKITDILLDLDNKIQTLIDEDNKVNGFGYVITRACYDVIIEEISKAEQKIIEIKNNKKNEMINHFRSVIK